MKYLLIIALAILSFNSYGQEKKHKMTNQEVVRTFLNGFNDPKQIKISLDLLAEDYKFKNPIVSLNSKAEFIALAKEIGSVITGIEIINMAENGNWVATFYNFNSSIQGLESNTASEWFKVENGIIKESHLIYDTSEWRKFYEQMEK
ncbi:MAG: nuclear transport factor 2 family protein [Flavipsychrobacter sp.]